MKAKPGKRTLSLFLALVLCLSLLPMTALAGGGDINVYYIAEGGSAVVDLGANPVQLKADGDGAYAFGLSFDFPKGVYTADNAGFKQIMLREDVDPPPKSPPRSSFIGRRARRSPEGPLRMRAAPISPASSSPPER